MKKFYSIFLLVASMTIISCGPSAEEKEAAAKKVQDSIEAAKVQMQAAMEAARQQYVEDSMAVVDTTVATETAK